MGAKLGFGRKNVAHDARYLVPHKINAPARVLGLLTTQPYNNRICLEAEPRNATWLSVCIALGILHHQQPQYLMMMHPSAPGFA